MTASMWVTRLGFQGHMLSPNSCQLDSFAKVHLSIARYHDKEMEYMSNDVTACFQWTVGSGGLNEPLNGSCGVGLIYQFSLLKIPRWFHNVCNPKLNQVAVMARRCPT